MKTIRFTVAMLVGLLFTSCASDEPSIPNGLDLATTNSTSVNPYHVSVDEAIQVADKLLLNIGDIKTRSSRQVESVAAITETTPTRASENAGDTLLYIINYCNDEGFAIVSADKRALPVYALSDSGHFQIDEDSNPAIEKMLGYAKESARYRVKAQGVPGTFPGTPGPPDSVIFDQLTPHKKIAPMLSARQNRLGSNSETSKYVVNEQGETALTCCGPIGVELIMSYYKWPEKLMGQTFNWDAMNAGNNDDGIARLLGILSGPGYVCVYENTPTKYGYCYVSSLLPALQECGYEQPNQFKNFYNYEDTAISYLDNGPLLINASSSQPKTNGHVWVIDGLLQYYYGDGTTTPSESGIPIHNVKLYTYYHCVWGDSGKCNGYYLVEDHDFNGAPDFFDAVDPKDMSGTEYRQYSKDVEFSGNFEPIKSAFPTFPPVIINP